MLDDTLAFLTKLQGNKNPGLKFHSVLGKGKSAAVFLGEYRESQAAIKVYDSSLLERYGCAVQEERLNRELSLCDHNCEDLVKIYGGGELWIEGLHYHYVAMEYVEGMDLRKRLQEVGRLNEPEIRRHLASLARAAGFLHDLGFCHRDIKTDNCALRSDGSLVLLDLGVLRPIGNSDFTDTADDPKTKYFLGTLRYAPPEFLRRQETDDLRGWQAVSTYQIGTVLYEMIQGTLLFSHVNEPYAELVLAVMGAFPELLRADVGMDLIKLTRCCLTKDPNERLRLVPWRTLLTVAETPPSAGPTPSEQSLILRMQSAEADYARLVEGPTKRRGGSQRPRKTRFNAH